MKLLVVIPTALTIGVAALGLYRAVMNRRVGKLVAVAVVLVAISSSAACGSGSPKAVGGNATVTPTTAIPGPNDTPSTNPSGSVSPSTGSPESNSPSPTTEPDSPSPSLPPDPTFLADLTPVVGGALGGQVKVNAHLYLKSIRQVSYQQGGTEYDLNRQWKYFMAVVGLSDDAPADARMAFQVFMDGHLRDTETDISLGHPKAIRIDAQGFLRLKLVATQTAGDQYVDSVWADAQLTNDSSLRLTA